MCFIKLFKAHEKRTVDPLRISKIHIRHYQSLVGWNVLPNDIHVNLI